MNNIKVNMIIWGMSILTLSGCTDSFLSTTSKTSLNTTTFYKTEEQAEEALVGCYDQYQRTISNGSYPTMYQAAEMMSDECFGGGSSNDITNRLLDRFDQTMKSDATDIFAGIWSDYFKSIYNSNLLISSLNGISWTNTSDRSRIEGEVRALRALAYFDMVRMFENVPLQTEPTNDVVPQSDPKDIYAQIVSDLKYAAENIPANLYTDNNATLGHISRYAAAAMLVRVYLFYDGVYNNNQGEEMPGGLTKNDALAYCETIINSGVYKLESDFSHLWPAACTEKSTKEQGRKTQYNEASQEIVWVVKFNNDQNWTNGKKNYNSFVINIGMPNASYAPYGNGWGACPISTAVSGWYDEGDKRASATIIDSHKLLREDGESVFSEQIKTDCADFTGFTICKYAPMIYADGTTMQAAETDVIGGNLMTSQDQDYILMRYSDVLLMAAELGSKDAIKDYNLVVERAYGNTSHNISSVPTREQIWNERRKEFVGEGIRYWDLRRQGLDAFVKAIVGQASIDGKPIEVYANGKVTTIAETYKESNIREKRGFWQIPTGEIRLSGNVYKQNAGW